jgi:hypothetical protein
VKTMEHVESHCETREVPSGKRYLGENFYSWLDSYLGRLEGKEARREYYVRLAR